MVIQEYLQGAEYHVNTVSCDGFDEIIALRRADRYNDRLTQADPENLQREQLSIKMDLHGRMKKWLNNRLEIKIGLNTGGPFIDGLLEPDVLLPFLFIEHPDLSEDAKRAIQKFVENYEEAGRTLQLGTGQHKDKITDDKGKKWALDQMSAIQDLNAKRMAQRPLKEVVVDAARRLGPSLKDGVKSATHRLHRHGKGGRSP